MNIYYHFLADALSYFPKSFVPLIVITGASLLLHSICTIIHIDGFMLATRFSPCARYRHRSNARIHAVVVHCKRMISTLANVYNILEKSKEIEIYFEVFVLLGVLHPMAIWEGFVFPNCDTQLEHITKKACSDYQPLVDINISLKSGIEVIY